MFTLSILDQSPILSGDTAQDALNRTIELAQVAERLGFKRFWVSEHHQSKEVAGSSPEVLVSHILAKTEKIIVGSGGVMLTHYSPYKVAENFHVLANLAPGRVDLGIGKAPGGLPQSTKALQYNGLSNPDDFNDRLKQLIRYINKQDELSVEPATRIAPEVILLGGSVSSAKFAAEQKIPYVFAQFINGNEEQLIEAAKLYKAIYPTGIFMVGAAVIAAATEDEAERLAKDTDLYRVYLETGEKFTLTNFESAERFGKESGKTYRVERVPSPAIYGTIDKIEKHFTLFQNYGVDEIIVHNPVLEKEARLTSIELISQLNAVTQS